MDGFERGGDGGRDVLWFVCGGWWQSAPGKSGEIEKTGFDFGVVQQGPPVFEKGQGELGLRGELGEGRGAGEVLVLPFPTGEHVVGFTEVAPILRQVWGGGFLIPDVEGLLGLIFDLFGAPKANALGLELDAGAGQDASVVSNEAGGFEVFVELSRADEQDIANVGKALTTTAVRLKLF